MNNQLLQELEFNNVILSDTPQFKLEELKPVLLFDGNYTITVTKSELEILLKLPKIRNEK